jgi:hypothetical protein
MNNNKSIISILLCLVLVMSFAACTKPAQNTSGEATTEITTAAEVEATTVASIESEAISFYEAKDKDGNTLKLSPVYLSDGKTVVAAYIISGVNKDNKALDAKSFSMLNSVVSATSGEKSISLSYDSANKLIKIESYADEQGNLLAIMDINDANKNNNKTEYLKLTKTTNQNGSTHYLLTNEAMEIKKENGKTVAIDKKTKKKTVVQAVDSSNKTVADKVEKDTASNEEKSNDSGSSDNGSSNSSSGSDSGSGSASSSGSGAGSGSNSGSSGGTNTTQEKVYNTIVLKKNGKSESSLASVETNTNEVVINDAGDYKITSETDTWHGVIKLKLKNTEAAELRFEDVDISYNKGSIIQLIDESDTTDRSFIEAEATAGTTADNAIEALADRDSAPNVDLTFPTGTKSSFENSANAYTGVLYNEAKLTIKGNGKATFKAVSNSNHAIASSKSITIKNVELLLQSASYDVPKGIGGAKGIYSYNKVNIESGKLTVQSNGDAIRCDSYYQDGGTVSLASSACDGIDADDAIYIKGGSANIVALEKTSLKVRRVNNQDTADAYIAAGKTVAESFKKNCIRSGKDDGFAISGGTVSAESYKVSTPRKSTQKVIICKASKEVKGSEEEVKKAVKWEISTLASTKNKSIKFFYSASDVKEKEYKILVDGGEASPIWTWSDNVGVAKIVSSTSAS